MTKLLTIQTEIHASGIMKTKISVRLMMITRELARPKKVIPKAVLVTFKLRMTVVLAKILMVSTAASPKKKTNFAVLMLSMVTTGSAAGFSTVSR